MDFYPPLRGRTRKAAVFEHSVEIGCSSDSDNNSETQEETPLPPPKKPRHEHTIFNISQVGNTASSSQAQVASPKKKQTRRTVHFDASVLEARAELGDDFMRQQLMEPLERNPEFSSLASMYEEEFPDEQKVKAPRIRNLSDHPVLRWIRDDREEYLQESIRLEGRGSFVNVSTCAKCKTEPESVYRCEDCSTCGALFCGACMSTSHMHLPYHRIEARHWTGTYFERAHLKDLGVRIQLGHPRGEQCLNPEPATSDDFVIIDVLGIHEVALDFCACQSENGGPKRKCIQLLRANLYPSTSVNPRTAATFNTLKHFHILSFESKITPYEYIHALERLTCNTDNEQHRDRYEEFVRMVQQWRNLKLLKRAGRGHACGGIPATKAGECAILCPACPQPNINLPHGWELEPEDRQWLYALFLGIDGNFRLKRKRVSDDEHDPGLCQGWAYVVEETAFKAWLAEHWDYKQERSTCVNHNAVNQPDKEARGLAASGATTTDCIRHDFKRPNGVGDFQKGERYINTDYVFFSSISGTKIRRINVSYDVACQWLRHIFERAEKLPPALRFSICIIALCFFIPKFHISAHNDDCNRNLSFNLTPGSGRTDGEAPERGWANINPLAQSTKEMGPGSRRDTLDDHFNDWNWKKVVGMKSTLLTRIEKAVPERAKHASILRDFERAVPEAILAEWSDAVASWEKDRSKPNPYEVAAKRPTEKAVRLELSQDAAEKLDGALQMEREAAADRDAIDVHPSLMVAIGLDIEGAQRVLKRDVGALGLHPTASQLSKLVERSNKLRRKIAGWQDIQAYHMPQTVALREHEQPADETGTKGVSAQSIKLYLPSSLKSDVSNTLRMYEWKLREGQAYDALDDLRHHLRLRSQLYHYKDKYARGVKQNTRSVVAIETCQMKVDSAATKYRDAYQALVNLAPYLKIPHDWSRNLRMLATGDVRGLSNGNKNETEGTRKVSWIWRTEGILPDQEEGGIEAAAKDPGFHDALRIEWCRTRARAMRWAEEVELLEEEMRRVLQFCAYKSNWWVKRGKERTVCDEELRDGLEAYATQQSSMWLALKDGCDTAWKNVKTFVTTYKDPDVDVDEETETS